MNEQEMMNEGRDVFAEECRDLLCQMETALLQLEHVSVDFLVRQGFFGQSAVRAVRDVSLSLERGEHLAVVGESGSGKTTLGRALLGLVRATSGSITYRDADGHGHRHGHSHGDGHGHRNRHRHSDGDADGHADRHGHAHGHRDGDTHVDARDTPDR